MNDLFPKPAMTRFVAALAITIEWLRPSISRRTGDYRNAAGINPFSALLTHNALEPPWEEATIWPRIGP